MKYEFQLESEVPEGLGKRHIQTFLGMCCMGVSFLTKGNLSIAIVAMTDSKSNNSAAIFDWNKKTQNDILSSFYFGYLSMMVPWGILAHRFGGKLPIVIALSCGAIISFIFPFAARVGGWLVACACRFAQGMVLAAILPCVHNIIGKWFPFTERGRATAAMHSGAQFGKVATMTVSGYLVSTSVGWPLVFYVTAAVTLLGCALFYFLAAASPSHHKSISNEELKYITTSCHDSTKRRLKTPWKSLLTSLPFWVVILAQGGFAWNLTTMMMEIPSYLNYIIGVNIKNNGLLSAGPYVAMIGFTFAISNVLDTLIKKRKITSTTARKVSNSIGMWLSGVLIVAFSFIPANLLPLAIFLLILGIGAKGGGNSGYTVALTDIAPNFSGNTVSIGATFANFLSGIAPLVNAAIIKDVHNVVQWRYVFGLSSGIMFMTNLAFVVFGTCEVQSWNDTTSISDVESIADRNQVLLLPVNSHQN